MNSSMYLGLWHYYMPLLSALRTWGASGKSFGRIKANFVNVNPNNGEGGV